MQFLTLGSSKIEISETEFFDIETTHNDHPCCVKHVLGSSYVFFMLCVLFGYWVCTGWGGGVPQGAGAQPAYAVFHPGQLKNRSFQNLFPDIVATHNDHPSYGKHVVARIYVFFTLFEFWVLKVESL